MKLNTLLVDTEIVQYANILRESMVEYDSIILFESLKLLHDRDNGILAVSSTEVDPKKAQGETYRNKDALKQAGFRWTGGYWVIDATEFNTARNVISRINKTEYIISKLEDAEEFIGDATSDPKKSALKKKITDYVTQLASETDEAAASAEIKRYLDFFAGFHQYSFGNRILIYIQNPNATKVASYAAWKKKGRQVGRGSKGMEILVPIFAKGNNPKYDDVDDNVTPVGYKVGRVFDIADTNAINEMGEVPDTPEWWGDNTPSETADRLYYLVKAAAESDGIDITNNPAVNSEKGYSAGGHINITSDVEGVGRVSTMVHEYAHELMHRPDAKFYVGDYIVKNSAVKELQAESTSYVVLRHYDIPVQHHTKYLALWKATGERIKQNMESISMTARYIIKKIDAMEEKSNGK